MRNLLSFRQGALRLPCTHRYGTLNPDANLVLGATYGATYIATVTTGAKDLAGNSLDQVPNIAGNQPKTWTFTVRP